MTITDTGCAAPVLKYYSSRLLRAIEALLGVFCALLLAGLLTVVLTSVILRYGFNTGILGAEELAIWLFIALIACGTPLVMHSALAMRLDILTMHLPPFGQRLAALCADCFTIMCGLIFSFGPVQIISLLGGISPSLGVPEWIRFGFFGFAGGSMLLVLALQRITEGRIPDLLIAAMLSLALYSLPSHTSFATELSPSIILGLIALAGLLVAAPLPHAFLTGAYLTIAFGGTMPEPAIVSATVNGVSKFLLLAIPFFLLAGSLLALSGIAAKIVQFAASLVGHRRGGLAQTTLLTSLFFSGASGSSVANAAFSATTFQPELVKHGYPPAQAGAIIAAASVLDNVIPPSIAFLILAAATNLSVGALLLGGFFAGFIMALCLAIAIHLTTAQQPTQNRASAKQRLHAVIGAIPAFGLGIIIVAGIRMGVVTTTEAAAVAALYTFLIAICSRISWQSLYQTFKTAGIESAAIGLLIASASPFAFMLAVDDISGLISDLMSSFSTNPLMILLAINLILLVVGLVLDIGAAILLFGPIFLPIAVATGLDPVMFGVILVVNLMIGGLTPPMGMLVFVVSGITRLPVGAIFKAMTPYFFALVCALAILGAWALLI